MPTSLTLLSAVLVALALGALGAAATLWQRPASAPREVRAVVTAHDEVHKSVTVGGRSATRREVPMTRVALRYELDGAARSFTIDRAQALASEQLPVGASLTVYVDDSGEASLEPRGARTLPLVLAIAGALLLAAAALLFLLGRRP